MIRAPFVDEVYWDARHRAFLKAVIEGVALGEAPAANPIYDPQFQFNLCTYHVRLILVLYSSGAPIRALAQHIPGLLDSWERSNRLSAEICAEYNLKTCRDWDFSLSNLNHYNWCFWLVGLAQCLEIPEDQWQRLLTLIGGAGEDVLLDRVIAGRTPSRTIGTQLLHAKPYARLLKAVDAPMEQQAVLLRDFVDHWYAELKRRAPKNRKAPPVEPFWYIYGDPEKHPLEKGSYFGRWCIEAAAVVKALGVDDKLCLGHDCYPGDLLRPDEPNAPPGADVLKTGWLNRLLRRQR